MKYELSKLAEEDIRGIWDYTSESWGIEQAEKYLEKLEEQIRDVATNIEGLSQDRSNLKKGVRSFLYNKHTVFFKIKGGVLYILRVLHQRMDIEDKNI